MNDQLSLSIGKRTGIDFSQHEVIVTEQEGLLVHYLKKPGTICNSIKYINTNGILAVTGDFGNWIFCREFRPSVKGYVSDSYWLEKLRNSSTQDGEEFDSKTTQERIEEQLNGGLEEYYGYEGDDLEKMREYLTECLDLVKNNSKQEYEHFAYMEHPFGDSESVICCTKTKIWLQYIFDGFDEMCQRLKEEEIKIK